MPNVRRDRRDVAALLYDELCTFEFSIAAEIFGLPRPEFGKDWYRFRTASEKPGPLRANGGVTVAAEGDLSILAGAGTIVIPGWHTRDERPPPAVQEALLEAHRDGARIVGICSATFLIAELGLLEGKCATTHWLYADKLQSRFPSVQVDPARLFTAQDSIYTSAGSAAGIDLCMHVVREDWGAKRANAVARRLVMPPFREGDQRQYVARPIPETRSSRLHDLIERLHSQPELDWSIDKMASDAAMSRRTFIRRFRDATGETPIAHLHRIRIEAAKELLESPDVSLDSVAERSGYGSLASMQQHFRQSVGCSPSSYRQQFGRVA